jgi:transposase-like protein
VLRFERPRCKFCQREKAFHRHPTKQCYTCNCGRSHIYPRKGTLFEQSPLPLEKWFRAIVLLCESPAGVRPKQLQRYLNVTYTTAWSMAKKIRAAIPPKERYEPRKRFEILLRSYCLPPPQRKHQLTVDAAKHDRSSKQFLLFGS